MNFGRLIKYNRRNICLRKSYTQCGRETILRSFSKKKEIQRISGSIKSLTFYTICFIVYLTRGMLKYIGTKAKSLGFNWSKVFFKNKGRSGTRLFALLSTLYLKENISHALHKTWSFPVKISLENVTGNCRFGHIYWRNS